MLEIINNKPFRGKNFIQNIFLENIKNKLTNNQNKIFYIEIKTIILYKVHSGNSCLFEIKEISFKNRHFLFRKRHFPFSKKAFLFHKSYFTCLRMYLLYIGFKYKNHYINKLQNEWCLPKILLNSCLIIIRKFSKHH